MDWKYALAGGLAEGGDAYADKQKKQRAFKMKQKDDQAEDLRREHFAKYNYDLGRSDKAADEQKALADYTAKGDVDDARKGSGMVDPKTQVELTKGELAKRGNAEGLISTQEVVLDRRKTQGDADFKNARQRKVDQINADYEPGSRKHTEAMDKLNNVSSKSEPIEELTANEKKRVRTNFSKSVSKAVKEETLGGKESSALRMQKILEQYGGLSDQDQRALSKESSVQDAIGFDNVASSLLKQKNRGEITEKQARAVMTKAGYTKKDFDSMMEYLVNTEQIESDGKMSLGNYKGNW